MLPADVEVSFEFFPPKTPETEESLWRTIRKLEPLAPRFVSVTYGAGGSTQAGTRQMVTGIQKKTDLTAAAHLTCVGASRAEIDAIARDYWRNGVRHIVALRGDLPEGSERAHPRPDGYAYSSDLVAGLKRIADFDVSVAAYPEKHPEAPSLDADIDNLKKKVDAGADRAITQYFFEPSTYFRFLDKVRAKGITVPVVAGLVPVTNFEQIVKFSKMCGATVPGWLHRIFEGLEDDAESRRLAGMAVMAEQMRQLLAGGVREFHIYTLNRAPLPFMFGRLAGMDRQPAAEMAAAS
ncbi:MAG TPA: methylenetetrahydrofolate reductase [NAD(P)H] [Alphaproteobacteria bacterium]|nr:methylenetetrahydrofolate reductase [NAD(P)H] [Alphaproteobacteria bacterium]